MPLEASFTILLASLMIFKLQASLVLFTYDHNMFKVQATGLKIGIGSGP
jgi:hypothetical protein